MRTIAVLTVVGLLLVASSAAQANLVTNGSFEDGSYVGGSYMELTFGNPNATAIQGWTVTGGSVDWIGSYWPAADGSKSIDMSGLALGTLVSQTIVTTPGNSYLLTFQMAGNTDGPPTVKQLGVFVDPATGVVPSNPALFSFDTTNHNRGNMGWTEESMTFTASSNATTITFTSLLGGPEGYPNTDAFGAALDDVSVTDVTHGPNNGAVPAPAAVLLGLMGLSGLGVLMRRYA
jgi:choice-of-anchor C domain-containing protein